MVAPPVVWRPDDALLRESNVARFMAAERVDDFATLVRRSIDGPDWFWDAVVRFLGLPFDAPYAQVLDTWRGCPLTRPRSCGRAKTVRRARSPVTSCAR
jgi:hypothetical protein